MANRTLGVRDVVRKLASCFTMGTVLKQIRNTPYRRKTALTVTILTLLVSVSACHQKRAPDPKFAVREALDAYYEGERLLRQGDVDSARQAFERSIEVSPRPRARWRLAQILIEQSEYDRARQELDAALAASPGFGLVQIENERLEAKISVEETLTVEESSAPESTPSDRLPAFAFAGGAVGDPGRPMPQEQRPEGTPTPTPTPTNLSPEQIQEMEGIIAEAKYLASVGDNDAALKRYKDVLMIDPGRGEVYYRVGTIYLNDGQPRRAVIELRQAVDLDSSLAAAYNNLGVAYEQIGEIDPAIAAYGKAIEAGEHLDAYYNLGVLLEKTGSWEEAIEAYRSYVKRDPGSEWGRKADGRLRALERAIY